jgi:hypothetical protein
VARLPGLDELSEFDVRPFVSLRRTHIGAATAYLTCARKRKRPTSTQTASADVENEAPVPPRFGHESDSVSGWSYGVNRGLFVDVGALSDPPEAGDRAVRIDEIGFRLRSHHSFATEEKRDGPQAGGHHHSSHQYGSREGVLQRTRRIHIDVDHRPKLCEPIWHRGTS